MQEAELVQIMTASGPAGVGVIVLALLLKQWLGQVRGDLLALRKQIEILEKTLQTANLAAASHQASTSTKLNELDRRVSALERTGP